MTVAFFILLTFVLVVLAIDFIPQLLQWQSRIGIGRWNDKSIWREKVLSQSLQWLNNTPTIKLTDNKRLIIIDMLKGNYSRHAIQHWQQAALLLGLSDAYLKTNDTKIKTQIDRFVNSKIDSTGNWKEMPQEIDGVILAYALMKTDQDGKYKLAYDAMWQLIQNLIGEDGTVQYRRHMKDFRYVDTIGFICPFLIRYGTLFQNAAAVDLGCKQIAAYNENAMYQDRFIPCHAYNVKTAMTSGLYGWGRGLGWYAIGLIDAWRELPENHPQKSMLTESVIKFAPAAIAFQQPYGAWNWLITNNNTTPDSSATATIAWLLSEASAIPEIAGECLAAKEKAMQYLMKVTKRTGAIDLSQGDTKGVGLYSHEFDILPFTQGFALRTMFNN